ncbi:hypothetical protein MJO28_015814 [Puccinia striiformis f. sp. tritici]|uniref:Uncharacterized protein n=1 Tax=Puccinia striiformis f. sp. tritici TaxID=168172 RepID=A0ACC0DRR1_9BASI|nr:hypothetical protein MJO28_015814 [Puccinia striiformis f. sp. tritici]
MDISNSQSLSVEDHIVQEVASQLTIQSASNDRIALSQTLLRMDDEDLTHHIMARSNSTYGQVPKPLQVQAVINLVRGRHTFLLAGTGFGKSRVSEMFFHLYARHKKAVTLVLNPLDTLGDNQVAEKLQMGISAVNLTKMTLNEAMAARIINGEYSFVYMSPEAFLNNPIFTALFFNPTFQNRLALVVVDEGHMIYMWGLVASGKSKKLSSHSRHEDRAVYRPSYGKIGPRLLATNGTPVLIQSATCRPLAIKSILESLKILPEDIDILQGELTRPEIRLIRVEMDHSLGSCDDLLAQFADITETSNDELVPMLIYSTTRALTKVVSKVVHEARGIVDGHEDPFSRCCRQFHAVTGDLDKDVAVKEFAEGVYPMISATMALGLGQNWSRVRSVIHMGRGDPASIAQMIGRCGRDGRPGLGIIFVEKNRKNGKNRVDQFPDPENQGDDDRMDALAITPVCLRIAFSLDNLVGYIPLSFDNPNYRREKDREEACGFLECLCSNCHPEHAAWLMANLRRLNRGNFTSLVTSNPPPLNLAPIGPPMIRRPTQSAGPVASNVTQPIEPILEQLAHNLVARFQEHFDTMGCTNELEAEDLFSIRSARAIANCVDGITKPELRRIIGGDIVRGQVDILFDCVMGFKSGSAYLAYTTRKSQAEAEIIQRMETLRNRRAVELHRTELARQEKAEQLRVARMDTQERRRIAAASKAAAAERKRLSRIDNAFHLNQFKAIAKAKADARIEGGEIPNQSSMGESSSGGPASSDQ